jgi:ribose transport system ATP-binding protein
MADARLVIRNLNKSYASPVLRDVSLSIARGEIHGLVGENGAGKTTLVNILTGLTGRDSGDITLDSESYEPRRPADAFARGVSFAAQELSTVPTLTVAENLQLRDLPRRSGVIRRDRLADVARGALQDIGLQSLDTNDLVQDLSVPDRQLLEFAKATIGGPGLLLLDEPTAALAQPEADRLHDRIRALADGGVSIIYISHRLDDVLALADRVSVLRDGTLVASDSADEFTVDSLVRHMAGDLFSAPASTMREEGGVSLLRIDDVTTPDLPNPLSLTVRAREIVGLAGLAGAGRSELLHAAFGLVPLTGGSVECRQGNTNRTIDSARTAVESGMALLSEDRQSMGLYPGQSVLTNIMLPGSPAQRSSLHLIDSLKEAQAAGALVNRLGIRCEDLEQDISELSGGNQQKALIARWLHCGSQVFLLDEPTRGVDIATRSTIYELLRALAAQGCGIVIASSEIEELMTVSDRIVVLSDRRIAREFVRPDWSEAEILAAAFSAYADTGQVH